MNPHDAARNLAASLKKSPECTNFMEAHKKLKTDAVAENILNDLREIQLEMQEIYIEGKEIPKEKEEKYKKLSEAANFNLTVKKFIEAEYRFALIMGDIQKIIADAIEIE